MTQKMKELWWMAPLLALLSMGVSGFVAYTHEREGTSNRVTAVETRQVDDRDRLNRIENKIDRLTEQMQQVLSKLTW